MPLRFLFVSVLFVACCACQHGPPPPSAAAPPTALRCGADADCVAVDHSCDSCRCIPLEVNAPRPTCDGSGVQCFVAPCRGQRATCQDGVCALSDSNEDM